MAANLERPSEFMQTLNIFSIPSSIPVVAVTSTAVRLLSSHKYIVAPGVFHQNSGRSVSYILWTRSSAAVRPFSGMGGKETHR